MRSPLAVLAGVFTLLVAGGFLFVMVFGGPSAQPVPAASKAHCPDLPAGTASNGTVPGNATRPTVHALRGAPAVATPSAVGTPGNRETMPYQLPAQHGKTGREEPVDDRGRVPSTGMPVTWAKHAALGAAYRDYYITMLWRYATWDFNGHSRDIDQAQYEWFAARPRLVLVTNPRTHESIIAAAIEAGPGPWVSFGGDRNGPAHGWKGFERGAPAGFDGIVSWFPPPALAALGARTGYRGETGDDLIYQ